MAPLLMGGSASATNLATPMAAPTYAVVAPTTPSPIPLVTATPGSAVASRLTAAAAAACAASAIGPVTPCDKWVPQSGPPLSLTQGMPDPATVQKQKDGYVRTLDDQLRQGSATLDNQHRSQRDTMHQAAEEQKKQFGMQIDQQVKLQEMDLDQQFLQVLQYVKQQATRQRAQLEQQAMQLSFEYQEKKVEEDMLAHQFELSKHQLALKGQINAIGPLSPLPSYKPAMTTVMQPMPTMSVPSNPYAAAQVAAIASDAMAPALSYAPLAAATCATGVPVQGAFTVGCAPAYAPAQAPTVTYAQPQMVVEQLSSTATLSPAASSMMAASVYQQCVGSTVSTAVPSTISVVAAGMTYSQSPCGSRAPSYQPNPGANVYAVRSPLMTPTTSYIPQVLSPQPSAATLPLLAAPTIPVATYARAS